VANTADEAPESLLVACRKAVAGAALAGACAQILPSQRVPLRVDLTIYLHRDPGSSEHVVSDAKRATADYFGSAVLWRHSGIEGVVRRAVGNNVSSVVAVVSNEAGDVQSEPTAALGGVLNRYTVALWAVSATTEVAS
jgi:hypothetical protein